MFNAFDAYQFFFNPDADTFFYFLGCGAKVRYSDADYRNIDIRKGFGWHRWNANEAREYDQTHQQVSRDVVISEPGDYWFHFDACISATGAGRTSIPSIALLTVERQTVSRAFKPPVI